ncbi:DUF3920 family protein [Bacillus manliponensis]|uniref:DUF3920 domain-containing protein n=1 Tax=Bacillus manliponensis TaxID=574376 RepID=A0A073K3Q8_9BACI|nr:DUF3920 family protein [Bacillus manliponensis]KEK21231.1 hypothetical protein BAMA_00210 [Bacillus manliponensis]
MELPLEHIYERSENWYVLDADFPWDVSKIKKDLFLLIEKKHVPVVFCDTCSANDVLALLGEEEEEFLFPISGFYHKERSIIFICIWEQYEKVLETLLHEFRHHMQHEEHVLYVGNETYAERWIEKDAREFAKRKIEEYRRKCE